MAIHIIFQVCIELDRKYSSKPLCNQDPLSEWLWITKLSEGVGFGTKLLLLIAHIFMRRDAKDVWSTMMPTGTILAIACSSSFLTVGNGWGGVCQDIFG